MTKKQPGRFFLLPHTCRLAGWVILIPAFILAALRFYYDQKPKILEFKVFAVYSSYFDKKFFTFIQNNMAEEIAGILLLLGFLGIGFSKEKVEDQNIEALRLRSLLLAIYINSLLALLSLLLVFGLGFVQVLIANLYSTLIIYIIIFKYLLLNYKKQSVHV